MIKSDGSLYVPSDWTGINPYNGRFLKGHQPHNKGKRREEWMSKEGMKASSKGWENIEKHRCKGHPNARKARAKNCVAVRNNGDYRIFEFITKAAEWLGGCPENVRRCCNLNKSRKVCKHDWRPGFNKGADRVNTDHQYKGVRFYYADDPIWQEKIGKDIV